MDYATAEKIFATARSGRNGKPLENNTRLHCDHRGRDDFYVTLHSTDVVTIHKNGTYTLKSGGWHSMTTKDRINKYAPVFLYSEKGEWRLSDGTPWNVPGDYIPVGHPKRREYLKACKIYSAAVSVPFSEGMVVGSNGMPIGWKMPHLDIVWPMFENVRKNYGWEV